MSACAAAAFFPLSTRLLNFLSPLLSRESGSHPVLLVMC